MSLTKLVNEIKLQDIQLYLETKINRDNIPIYTLPTNS